MLYCENPYFINNTIKGYEYQNILPDFLNGPAWALILGLVGLMTF